MTNTESRISIWYHTIDSMLTAQEKESLIMAIELLLAERTEQCAKIAEDRISFIHQKEKEMKGIAPTFDAEGLHVKTYAEAAKYEAAFIAKEIRALNQPEDKSNVAI